MNATETVAYMRATGNPVRYAGGTQSAMLSTVADEVYGNCTIEGCEGCEDRSTVAEWIEQYTIYDPRRRARGSKAQAREG